VSLEAIFLSTFVLIGQNRQNGVSAGQGRPRLHRAGAGVEDEHRADQSHPHPDHRVAPAAAEPARHRYPVTTASGISMGRRETVHRAAP
jgi:hypothetical protein